eukprot:g17282.t1
MRIGQGRSVAFLPSTDIMQGSLEIVVKRGMHMEVHYKCGYGGKVLKSILCNLTDDEETRRVPGKAWREASVATAIVFQKDKSLVAHMLCHLQT